MVVTSFVMLSAKDHVHAAVNTTPGTVYTLDESAITGTDTPFSFVADTDWTRVFNNSVALTKSGNKIVGDVGGTAKDVMWVDNGVFYTQTHGYSIVPAIVFTAPVTGTYSYNIKVTRIDTDSWMTQYFYNGTGWDAGQTANTAGLTYTATVRLTEGQKIAITTATGTDKYAKSSVSFSVTYYKTPGTEGPLAYGNGTAPTVTTLAAGTKFPLNAISNGGNFYFTQSNDYNTTDTTRQGFYVSEVGDVTTASGLDANGAIVRNQAANQIKWTWGENNGTNRWMALNINTATDPTWVVNIEGNASSCVLQFVFVAPIDGYYSAKAEFIKRYAPTSSMHSNIVSIYKNGATTPFASEEIANDNVAMNTVKAESVLLKKGDELVIEWDCNGYMNHPTIFKTLDVTFDGCENHTGGTATCIAKKECTVCGESYGDFADHIPATDYSKDADYHWIECSVDGCDEAIDGSRATHTYESGVCVCDAIEPDCDHANCTKTYTHDANGHVATWTCGEVDTTDTTHSFVNGVCACTYACDHANCQKTYVNNGDDHTATYTCGAVDANDTAHDFTNGDCACGAKKPAPPTGDTAVSVAIALAVMSILGFAVVTKKRH